MTVILNSVEIEHKIRRIAYQIYEANINESEFVIAGIDKKGYVFAERLYSVLQTICDKKIKLCKVIVNKQDVLQEVTTSLLPSEYENKSIVIVDDVLNSGATLMYGVKHFLNVPTKKILTAVLVNRNHKKFPIKADFKGISLSTSLQEHIEVSFDGEAKAVLS